MKREPRPSGAIEAFTGRGYRVAGVAHAGGIIVSAAGAVDWSAQTPADVTAVDFGVIEGPVLLLFGTGPTLQRPDPALVQVLAGRGIALEVMDSRAAARTYNLLLGEGRQVAAALLPL